MARAPRSLNVLLAILITIALSEADAAWGRPFAWSFLGLLAALCVAVLLFVRPRAAHPDPSAHGAVQPLAPPLTGRELFREGLLLGLTGFGGGIATLAQIEHRLVARRHWVDEDQFLEAAALGQSLPGAVAANALGFIGLKLGSVYGALALMSGFIAPAFMMLLGFALAYHDVRHLSAIEAMFRFLTPAAAGLVAATALRMGDRTALSPAGAPTGWREMVTRRWPIAILLGAFVVVGFLGFGVIETLLIAGGFGLARNMAIGRRPTGTAEVAWRMLRWRIWSALQAVRTRGRNKAGPMLAALPLAVANPAATLVARGALLGSLTSIFLRAGALTFGGGFVMIPLLEAELVQARHWLTPQAFADAMALGQITPGPVVITATFVGYTIAGLSGAVLSTVAVFLPAFVLVVLVGSQIERFRRTAAVQGFLQGLQPAVIGLMFAAAVSIGRNGITDRIGIAVAAAAFLGMWLGRLSPVVVILGAGVLGLASALVKIWM